jgi:hypothetical protein
MKKFAWGLALLLKASFLSGAQPTSAASAAFDSYSRSVESRLAQQHRSADGFLSPAASHDELVIERISPSEASGPNGALLHHWRGTAFASGASAADFERLLRDFPAYPKYFAPQVLQARVLTETGDHLQVSMRVRQRHVITVVMDTSYDVTFGRLDGRHGYSTSQSTRIAEMDSKEQHGFLWRMNTFWSYEERDGGLYMQIEAVSLSRAIPRGLQWAIRGYVESIPRESLAFTLGAARNAVRKEGNKHE